MNFLISCKQMVIMTGYFNYNSLLCWSQTVKREIADNTTNLICQSKMPPVAQQQVGLKTKLTT
jgi:hypothetical protein